MRRIFIVAVFLNLFFAPLALAEDSWFARPHVGVGVNSQQGTSVIFGLDLGLKWDEAWKAGVTGHYSYGAHPERDRETGGGIFAGYALELTERIVGHFRQDLEYLDVRNPIDPLPASGPLYKSETGIATTSSVGFTVGVAERFAFTVGYRYVLGVTNSDLGEGRSGPTLGLMIGI